MRHLSRVQIYILVSFKVYLSSAKLLELAIWVRGPKAHSASVMDIVSGPNAKGTNFPDPHYKPQVT